MRSKRTRAGLYFHIKITKPSGVVISATKQKKLIFRNYLIANFSENDRAYLKVTYKGDLHNSGAYHTKKDLLHAYEVFTEKDLINDIINNY